MCARLRAGAREMSAHVFTERKTLKDECANILLIQMGVCTRKRNKFTCIEKLQGCVCVCARVCVREELRCNGRARFTYFIPNSYREDWALCDRCT